MTYEGQKANSNVANDREPIRMTLKDFRSQNLTAVRFEHQVSRYNQATGNQTITETFGIA